MCEKVPDVKTLQMQFRVSQKNTSHCDFFSLIKKKKKKKFNKYAWHLISAVT